MIELGKVLATLEQQRGSDVEGLVIYKLHKVRRHAVQGAFCTAGTGPRVLPVLWGPWGTDPPPHPHPTQRAEHTLAHGLSAGIGEDVARSTRLQVYREAVRLYRLRDRSSRFSEWPLLHTDLLELARPALQAGERLQLQQRMVRSYALFQP